MPGGDGDQGNKPRGSGVAGDDTIPAGDDTLPGPEEDGGDGDQGDKPK